ncbi:MAG: ADP-ribosylglycohydrolase family protein, partial [Clostridia bacterium]
MIREEMRDKIAGCLLGMATGDAMGMPGLFSTQATQAYHGGLLTDFVDAAPTADIDEVHYGMPAGMVTDDTLAAFSIVKSYIAHGLDPQAFANGYVEWVEESDKLMAQMHRRSLAGPNTQIALKRIKAGASIWETGSMGTTNGACMRIAPIGFLYPGDLPKTVDATYQTCIATHNTNIAVSAAGAIACAVSACAAGETNLDRIAQAAIEGARLGEEKGRKAYCPSIPRRCEIAIQIAKLDKSKTERRQLLYDVLGNDMPSYEIVPVAIGVLHLS